MNGGPPNNQWLRDLKAFVDLSCNKDVAQTRLDLDNRVGPPGWFAIGAWRNAIAYAQARLLPVLEETRILTQRAAEIGSAHTGRPIAIRVRRWQEQLFRTSSGVRCIDELWLMSRTEHHLRDVLVEHVVVRWVRELINSRLRMDIQRELQNWPGTTGITLRMNTDPQDTTIYFP